MTEPAVTPAGPSADKPVGPLTAAILVFDGVELLDVMGPAEVFVIAGQGNLFRVVLVAATRGPTKTMGGLEIVASHDYASAPAADIVVIPGGNLRAVDAAGYAWIKSAAAHAKVTMSVCMGALLLAKAGLLEGRAATTHHWGLEALKAAAPTCRVRDADRFVDDGPIVTTAGVTAGIDGALHLVERFFGADKARWAAYEWMEHRWIAGTRGGKSAEPRAPGAATT
jgi:transcriptional regulator GlxA family with amidase domain